MVQVRSSRLWHTSRYSDVDIYSSSSIFWTYSHSSSTFMDVVFQCLLYLPYIFRAEYPNLKFEILEILCKMSPINSLILASRDTQCGLHLFPRINGGSCFVFFADAVLHASFRQRIRMAELQNFFLFGGYGGQCWHLSSFLFTHPF